MCGTCNKSYISASGLRTHWKTTSCSPTPEEEAFTAEKSIFLLQQSDPLLRQLKMEEDGEEMSEMEDGGENSRTSGEMSPISRQNLMGGGGVESESGGQLVMDIDRGRSPQHDWRNGGDDHMHHQRRSVSPHHINHHPAHQQVHIIPADHLELADNMFNNGPTINVHTTSSSDEGERDIEEERRRNSVSHHHHHGGNRDNSAANITCI